MLTQEQLFKLDDELCERVRALWDGVTNEDTESEEIHLEEDALMIDTLYALGLEKMAEALDKNRKTKTYYFI